MNGSWLAAGLVLAVVAFASAAGGAVERWGRFEWTHSAAKSYKDPFTEVKLSCRFAQGGKTFTAEGFHDGGKTWKVRFMPPAEGKWTYTTQSNDPGLDAQSGSFECGPPGEGNHGPVVVRNKFHFAYADGRPYFQIGTTCYAWAHQGDELEQQTLATLAKAPFNKMRMCVFPKSYAYNQNEPKYYPFAGKPPKSWDFTRFNPEFFRHFEKRVEDLMRLGIEADLIVFHPYDRWGFKSMSREDDDRYLRYLVARLASFRNVWWSLANEFDLMLKIESKRMSDWDRFFRVIAESDPYAHWRGIHNCRTWYDHTRPLVTHASVQSSDFRVAADLRTKYGKPVIYDECKYEGNIPQGWGNISASQMVHRFWMGTCSGCYVGHGETYKHPKDILWWSKGGVLHGQSPPRIAFLKKIMQAEPYEQMAPDREISPGNYVLSKPGQRYLVYCLSGGPSTVKLPAGKAFKADGIDTWEMKVAPLGTARGPKYAFTPPKAQYLLRLAAYEPGEAMRPEATGGDAAGVTLLKRDKCDGGYRLYSSRQTEAAHLIDVDGREVHKWAYPQGKTWHYAEMQPDGNLIAIIKDVMILELDWNSRLVWKSEMRAHHDFARLPNGNTLVVSRRDMTNPWTKTGKLACDVLVELTPKNKAVWQWKVEEHADELAGRVKLMIPPSEKFWDFPHVNTIEVLPDSPAAGKDKRFRAGNLLICGRHIDTIWVIDRDTDRVVWAWGPGELLGPHMPTMLPNGHILVYDNGQNASTSVRGYTRVLEIEPIAGKIVWQYRADPPKSFYSPSRGSNERLPNGNTFIAESDSGRALEVTRDGEIVWDFVTPDRHRNGRPQALYRVCRYGREQVDRLLKEHKK